MKTKILYALVSIICLVVWNYLPHKSSVEHTVVEYATDKLPHSGVLKQKEDGFVYLQVDGGYINTLFPMLDVPHGFKKPPYYRGMQSPGAHISVFYGDERVRPTELGQAFHFTPIKIERVHTHNATYIILEVQSSELEDLRKKYGCKPLLKGHAFHISIAKKER
ncbi:MAG: HVSL domain-containing protein [Chlamydiales bacterium]|nr:HVSL domain-containing protein [Chlamydiales bacterium]